MFRLRLAISAVATTRHYCTRQCTRHNKLRCLEAVRAQS